MNRESKQLKKYREKWVGKAVAYRDEPMKVVGVGDDGAQCDYDQRRKYKPTGTLFLRDRYGAEHSAPEKWVSLHNAKGEAQPPAKNL